MTTTIRGTDNSAAAPALTGNDSDTGIYFPAANKLGLVTGGTERVIVDDSGRVGVGTSSPSAKLHIAGDNPFIRLDDTAGGSQQDYEIGTESAVFKIKNVGQATEPFTIDNSGNVAIANGNLVFLTNGTGIDFSASAGGGATSSILDDYEEGTWTPSIEGASTAGTTTYGANRLGWYRKIGSQVTVYYYIQVSATTGSGSLRISNLPFTTASSGIQSVGSVMTYLLNWTGSTTSIATYADGNRNYLLLYISGDDVSWANQLLTNETFELIGTHTYFA